MVWEDVSYRVEKVDHPHIVEFLTKLRQVYANGGVVLRSFRATDAGEFDQALLQDHRSFEQVFQVFLTRPSVINALPELQIELPLERPPAFHWMSALAVEGQLTHMLLVGGAYERFRGTVEQARALSRNFMEAIFGEELHHVGWSVGSQTPWTPWFCDIAWDATFVLMDHRQTQFVLLCATDLD